MPALLWTWTLGHLVATKNHRYEVDAVGIRVGPLRSSKLPTSLRLTVAKRKKPRQRRLALPSRRHHQLIITSGYSASASLACSAPGPLKPSAAPSQRWSCEARPLQIRTSLGEEGECKSIDLIYTYTCVCKQRCSFRASVLPTLRLAKDCRSMALVLTQLPAFQKSF